MLASLIGRHKAKGAPQGADSTWNIKVYVRNIESLPTKYTRLKVEFRESKGRKAALSEELSASELFADGRCIRCRWSACSSGVRHGSLPLVSAVS